MIKQPEAFAKEVAVMNGKLHLLSLYGDLAASARARRLANTIAKRAGPHWQTASEMWKIDSLCVSEPIRQMITDDAAKADVIIIAASSLEPALIQWLNSLEAGKHNRPLAGLLVGLLGDEETTTAELGGVVKPLLRSAQQMGWNFIWHWMGEETMSDTGWLGPSLENLLACKSATRGEPIFC
jgi:hypothetical protein